MSATKKRRARWTATSMSKAFLDFAGLARTIVELQVKDTIFPHYLRRRASSNSGKPL
jgi:hypothetical protein